MRRTNKRKYINKKIRITKKKRFGKRGGVEKKCPYCNEKFNIMSLYDSRYDAHIKTHPKCKYCGQTFVDKNKLIEHFLENHKNKYDVANSINLINELRTNNNLDLNDFYTRIEKKEKSDENKAAEKAKKAEQEQQKRLKIQEEEEKKIAKQTAIIEQARIKAEQEEQKKLNLEADKLRQKQIREQKALSKIKGEEEAKLLKEQAIIAKKEQAIMGAEEQLTKKVIDSKKSKKELENMENDDILSTEAEIALRKAQTVDDVIEIIEQSQSVDTGELTNLQEPLDIYTIIQQNDIDFLNRVNFFTAIKEMYPSMTKYNIDISNFEPYKNISYFIIFVVGIVNYRLREQNINLKLILKGGKAAQMILSEYNVKKTPIKSNDVDILLVQDNLYDYNFLLDFADQFANFIYNSFGDIISVVTPPNPILNNPNIVKISYKYLDIDVDSKGMTKSGMYINPINYIPNQNDYIYIPLSDIDFKNIDNEYFKSENIVSSEKSWNVYKNQNRLYTYNLLYYYQSLESFINEKKHYKQIYDNVIQKKSETENCDCSNMEFHDNECKKICSYRNLMIEKFNKYILPLEQLLQEINT